MLRSPEHRHDVLLVWAILPDIRLGFSAIHRFRDACLDDQPRFCNLTDYLINQQIRSMGHVEFCGWCHVFFTARLHAFMQAMLEDVS